MEIQSSPTLRSAELKTFFCQDDVAHSCRIVICKMAAIKIRKCRVKLIANSYIKLLKPRSSKLLASVVIKKKIVVNNTTDYCKLKDRLTICINTQAAWSLIMSSRHSTGSVCGCEECMHCSDPQNHNLVLLSSLLSLPFRKSFLNLLHNYVVVVHTNCL